jgi:monoamine oxidase
MTERRSVSVPHSCDVAVVGAGLSGLLAARTLDRAGVDVLVLEAQDRVGGRTLTTHLDETTFIDDGGQWVSPNQERIVALAAELGVELFPSWDEGRTVLVRDGKRIVADGLFLEREGRAAAEAKRAAERLAAMAESVPIEAPWRTSQAADWDVSRLHDWLAANVSSTRARIALATAIEGVFARDTTSTSLLAALYWIRCGDPLVPFTAADDARPERRFVGGAQQLSQLLAGQLGPRILLEVPVHELEQTSRRVRVRGPQHVIEARRAIVTLPPALAGRLRYLPGLPAARDHLCQRTPMRWVTKVHCVYPERFWTRDGLSGAVAADGGLIRTTADNSPPAGEPGILVGFIEEAEAVSLARIEPHERRAAVTAELGRLVGERAARPEAYREKNWGDDPYCRGADGGYWAPRVWTTYGHTIREPHGLIHWAGTETSALWNGKMEGALLAGERAATEVLERLGC